ncbi:MAG: AarF/ABC1/UbiB kinase family protein [Pseudomonadota bacterium]
MTDRANSGRPKTVPSHRVSRLAGLGKLAAGIASRTAVNGVLSLSRGEVPKSADLFLTAKNISKVTDELARMRGAALKLGQLLSMDAGEILPKELADLMARLRADADYMPDSQLNQVLTENLGSDWRNQFDKFDEQPIAAASIGQVHQAITTDGRKLAVKVQYPGVARSIESDINNVVSLFALTGLMPPKARLEPLIVEAKQQLVEEADYVREAESIGRFNNLMSGMSGFTLPQVQHDLSTEKVIAMSFVSGIQIEKVEAFDQETRNQVFTQLVRLALKELFSFGVMQIDPNFANYSYDVESKTIGLLDFGAVREFPEHTRELYRQFLYAGLNGDRSALRELALELGLYRNETSAVHRGMIDRMIVYVFGAMRQHEFFDFTDDGILHDLRAIGTELALDRSFNEIPPVDVLYLQRKAAGLFLLGRRLRAVVPLKEIINENL